MAALITATNLREHIDTDLVDAALQRLIDSADEDIVMSFGEHSSTGTVSELHIGGDAALFLHRPYASITSVTETRGTTATVLTANDWRGWYNRTLQRLSLGADNPQAYWGERVTIVYTPEDDDNQRIQATIDLVRLELQNMGLHSERVGDYSATRLDYHKERQRILARLNKNALIPG